MKMIKVFFLLLIFAISLSTKSYANAYSTEANYIFRNNVKITRIDSFLFKGNYSLDEKKFVAYSLIRYKSKEAIKLFKKMFNDSKPAFQSISIMPLINAGEFEVAFNKFRELIQQNEKEVLNNFYLSNQIGEFSDKILLIYKKHKEQFLPFLMELCDSDSVSYSIKYNAANTLYYLDEKDILKQICIEILDSIPNPEDRKKSYSKYTAEERQNWHLRYKAKSTLERLSKVKE